MSVKGSPCYSRNRNRRLRGVSRARGGHVRSRSGARRAETGPGVTTPAERGRRDQVCRGVLERSHLLRLGEVGALGQVLGEQQVGEPRVAAQGGDLRPLLLAAPRLGTLLEGLGAAAGPRAPFEDLADGERLSRAAVRLLLLGAGPALELPLGPVPLWEPHPLEAISGRSGRVGGVAVPRTASAAAARASSTRGGAGRRVSAHTEWCERIQIYRRDLNTLGRRKVVQSVWGARLGVLDQGASDLARGDRGGKHRTICRSGYVAVSRES